MEWSILNCAQSAWSTLLRYTVSMLRNLLIVIGLLVAINPYLGFPQVIDKFILTGLGLFIVFLLALSRRTRMTSDANEDVNEVPKVLHVERTEVEDSPLVHIERNITLDTERSHNRQGDEVLTEKQVTVVRRKKRKLGEEDNVNVFPSND